MPYVDVTDVKLGMDRRRERVAGTPGSAWTIKNAHITRGGEIERRKKFIERHALPADNTFGLGVLNEQFWVFGTAASPGVPVGVNYQQFTHPNSANMTAVLSVETFSGAFYVIAEFDDGSVYHFYNGSRVTDWDTIAGNVASKALLAETLANKIDAEGAYIVSASTGVLTIEAAVPGTPYTISKSTTDGGATTDQDITLTEVQANVSEVEEVLSSADVEVTGGAFNPGENQITSITIDGVEVLNSAVNWETSNEATALQIATQINDYTSSPDYTAEANNAVVTIKALEGTGSTPNGYAVATTTAGTFSVSADSQMGGGVDYVAPVAQIYTASIDGTFETADTFTITVDGTDFTATGLSAGMARRAFVFQKKVYCVVSSILYFSATNIADDWTGTGSGNINQADQNDGRETLTALGEYQGFLAVASQQAIRIWQVASNPADYVAKETIQNTGTVAGGSLLAYGNNDVFYLDSSGVRSLRARDSSNAAYVNDIGTAIDPFLLDYVDTTPEPTVRAGVSVIEPIDGRYWLAIGQRIFVFTFFPGSEIQAWSFYDVDEDVGGAVDWLVRARRQVFVRSGDKIFAYGGRSGEIYPDAGEIAPEIELPFFSAQDPATSKLWEGMDIALTGTWQVFLLAEPAKPSELYEAGIFDQITYNDQAHNLGFRSTHVAAKMVGQSAGPMRLVSMAIHFEDPHGAH